MTYDMSIFKSIKRGLGFSDGDDEADTALYADTAESIYAPVKGTTRPGTPDRTAPAAPAVEPLKFDPASQNAIFEKVVEIFNKSLPPFLAQSVDRDAQIKYLRDALDSGVRQYLDSLGEQAQNYCENRWQQTRESMAAELDSIKAKAADIEKKSADMQQKQLSADRQKRALADRVHDLEAQLVKIEADREQYELENRSLVNRLKVAGVQQEDVDSARAEIERLNLEIKRLRERPGENSSAEADAMKIQIEEMTSAMDSLKEEGRVAKQMLEDMRKNLAAANKRLADREKQLDEANTTIEEYNKELDKKMVEVGERLSRDSEKIKSLKSALSERDAKIESLRETISENLRKQARREKELQEEIARLKPRKPARTASETDAAGDADETPAPFISEDDLRAVEKSFESEDWFTKNPPAKTPSMRQDEDDDKFGYQEPPRRRSSEKPQNPSQLSLF